MFSLFLIARFNPFTFIAITDIFGFISIISFCASYLYCFFTAFFSPTFPNVKLCDSSFFTNTFDGLPIRD